jgi:hypothetical protein
MDRETDRAGVARGREIDRAGVARGREMLLGVLRVLIYRFAFG